MHASLKYLALVSVGTLLGCHAAVQHTKDNGVPDPTVYSSDAKSSPIYGVTIPTGYRQWQLIAPAHEEGNLDELRVTLGNGPAMKACREGKLPFPDGAILAKLAWKHVPLTDVDGAFIPGRATTVQFMVKDSKKYAATGGWGFGRFINGKPADEAQHKTCFSCHAKLVKDHDFVFTYYAP